MPREIQEQEIRALAYSLWEDAGSSDGREDEFWDQAKLRLTKEMGLADIDTAGEQSFPASDAVNHM